ncbi:UNVERIFIED_CONTAM: hypothetical protein RF653_14940 [Kocuria sp. CPCC 205316]|uniref:hypothetical protein n=1 Tax=Kocuria TaxID=57493 RepID=UPI0036DB0A7C
MSCSLCIRVAPTVDPSTPGRLADMKYRIAEITLRTGALLLLGSLVCMVMAMTAGQVPHWPLVATAMGAVLTGWGVFTSLDIEETPGVPLDVALERIRLLRHS